MTTSFKIVAPMTVAPANVIATNVPESPEGEWASGTAYTKGQRVKVTSVHKVYESVMDGTNTGKDPTLPANVTAWLEVGATNRYKVYDNSVSTQTVQPTSITYQLRMGVGITALSILNVVGAVNVNIRIVDPVYEEVYNLDYGFALQPASSTWHSWFFGIRSARTQLVLYNLPTFPNADIFITLTGGASLAVGTILVGQLREFGLGTNYGASVGVQDYSIKSKNAFGDTILLERAFAKRGNFDMQLVKAQVDELFSYLSSIRAKICLFIATEEYECTTIYGFPRDWQIVISYPEHADCSIEIEGMT